MECIHQVLALRNEADVGGTTVGLSLSKPNEYTRVGPEAFQVRMALWTVRSIVINDMADSQRGGRCFVKLDGVIDV